jgi:aminoglycoside-2''-adenylyltransferase
MHAFPAPWCVAGGWALDLFLGRVTRTHADLELAVLREDQAALQQQFAGWTLEKVVDGRRAAWPAGERLALPVHEIHAHSTGEPRRAIEFLLNEREGDEWVYRRDAGVRLPLNRWIVPAGGVPVLCPAIVLLFKAKAPRPKDEADFRSARDALGRERRRWLGAALRVCHSDHPWAESLGP